MPQRVAETGLLTATTLTIILILAVVTILGILWGMRLKRQRREADRIEIARVEDEGGTAIDPEAPIAPDDAVSPPPVAVPTAPVPVAPSPPPLDDGPVIATPAPEPSLSDEPVAAAAPRAASPASEAAPDYEIAPPTSSDGERPVIQIKGLGPKVAARLAELGITNVGQIAALDTSEAERLDAQLGAFTGRIARDRWIEQARFLAAGDVKGFEAVFGRL